MKLEDGSVPGSAEFWPKFFGGSSLYQQSYTQEIIEALMSDGSDLTNRVFFVGF